MPPVTLLVKPNLWECSLIPPKILNFSSHHRFFPSARFHLQMDPKSDHLPPPEYNPRQSYRHFFSTLWQSSPNWCLFSFVHLEPLLCRVARQIFVKVWSNHTSPLLKCSKGFSLQLENSLNFQT